ncbi:pseudouridine synthase [Flaviaesturariibacter amylovorans]|uniref:Pseudouridine synthase n=1 Tax=Flaviaesturariibacter amylovorans TaxID=1084520 RepID=A0ABP8HET9_9BACT
MFFFVGTAQSAAPDSFTTFASMSDTPLRYFVVNKPYDMLSQFIGKDGLPMLGDLDFDFPEGAHAIGRLDRFSEGLLLVTTDKRVTRLLFLDTEPHPRTYYVQVRKVVSAETVERLRSGIPFTIHGGRPYTSAPCAVDIVPDPGFSFATPYIYSPHAQFSWLRIVLTEGKFHQVRKMVKTVHHPCVRLVRTSISDLELGDLPAGGVRELTQAEYFGALRIGTHPPAPSLGEGERKDA